MKYYKISCGNGYCGCNEEWLMECKVEPEPTEVYDCYTYTDGAAGLIPMDENDEDYDPDYDITWEEYEQNIYNNMSIEEISEEEFIKLRDEESWEVR